MDLEPAHRRIVEQIIAEHLPDFAVWAFGSRVTGTARPQSDLDLAVITERPLDLLRMANLRDALEQSNVPFSVDLVDWATTSEEFRDIIRQHHIILQSAPN